ncbi:MAG: CHRD domain-containing protein [Nitrososphaeraceae archaeon]
MGVNERSSSRMLSYSLIALLLVPTLVLLLFINPVAYSVNLDRFWGILTADQQVPPTNSTAKGFFGAKFMNNFSRVVYSVNVEGIGNVTGIYLKNQNGTIILDLLNETRELRKNIDKVVYHNDGITRGTIALGAATKKDLQGTLEGKPLYSLLASMVNGSSYIVINTKEFPNGEIRGNSFVGIDRVFPDIPDIKWKKR